MSGLIALPLTWLLVGLIAVLLAVVLRRNFQRFSRRLVVVLGCFTLGLYILPLPVSSEGLSSPWDITLFFTSLLVLPALAWFTSAMLLRSLLEPAAVSAKTKSGKPAFVPAEKKRSIWTGLAILALVAALLAASLQHLYWIFTWDATNDPIGVLLQIPVIWLAASAALLLVLLLWNWRRWLGIGLAVLFVAAVSLVIQMAMRIDYRQLTEQRAADLTSALERRLISAGAFPESLDDLVPGYLWSIPPPLVIYGLDWCYEGSADYYHLGYLTRAHWSSPELLVRSYSSAGALPKAELDCSAQIAVLEARNPGLYSVFYDLDR